MSLSSFFARNPEYRVKVHPAVCVCPRLFSVFYAAVCRLSSCLTVSSPFWVRTVLAGLLLFYSDSTVLWGRDSSVGIATRYGLDGPWIETRWGARFSAPVQTGPGEHPASCTMSTGSFLRVKRPGRGVAHPAQSSAEVEGRVELYICSPFGPSWPVIG